MKLHTAIQSSRIAMAAAELGAAMRPLIASARQQLLAVIVTAKKQGYYAIECEARLVLDELTMKTNSSQGRSQLVNLADDARRHGLELVARKAVQLQALSGR